MANRITSLCFDAADPELLAAFWCAVLDWQITDRDEDLIRIQDGPGATAFIDFLLVADRRQVKNRLHLDVNATDRDQAAELERLLGLGARPVDVGQRADVSWHVLADPEGNEFCLLSTRVPPLHAQ